MVTTDKVGTSCGLSAVQPAAGGGNPSPSRPRTGRPRPPAGRRGRLQGRWILAAAPQSAEIRVQLGRKRRFDIDSGVGERVIERKPACVQELTAEGLVRNSVDRVSDDRQFDRSQMNPDLVRPAGLEPY